MFGSDLLYTALNVSSITNELSTYGFTGKALFSDVMIPKNCNGKNTINFYMNENLDGSNNVFEYDYIINCRAETYKKSRSIASIVFNTLNRVHGVDSFKLCNVGQTIPPIDDTDVYNTPIFIKIKVR